MRYLRAKVKYNDIIEETRKARQIMILTKRPHDEAVPTTIPNQVLGLKFQNSSNHRHSQSRRCVEIRSRSLASPLQIYCIDTLVLVANRSSKVVKFI